MPGSTVEPTLEELHARLDRVNQSLMVTALARRLSEKGLETARDAATFLAQDNLTEANQKIGQSQAFTLAANLALAVAQEL